MNLNIIGSILKIIIFILVKIVNQEKKLKRVMKDTSNFNERGNNERIADTFFMSGNISILYLHCFNGLFQVDTGR